MAGKGGVPRDPYDFPRDGKMGDLLRVLERRVKVHIRTMVPATVKTFYPAPVTGATPFNTGGNPSADVLLGTLTVGRLSNPAQLPENVALVNPARGEITYKPILLPSLPVVFPGGPQGGITWPVLPGDTGYVLVSDRSLERWKLVGAPTDPVMAATHALEDSVFVPGLRAATTAMSAVDMAATVVDGATTVKVGDATATSAITKAEELIAAVDAAFAAAISASAGKTVANGGADGGAAGFAALQSNWESAKETIKAIKGKVT